MPQYIKRSDAIDALINNKLLEGGDLQEAVDAICSTPAADVRPVVRGKWVMMFDSDEYPARTHWLCCSICGHIAPFGRMSDIELKTNFCSNCGADMREAKDA